MAFNVPTDGNVYVASIKKINDDQAQQVELRSEREKTAEENPLGFLMDGHNKFTGRTAKRVIFQNISNKRIAEWKLAEGVNFSDACGKKAKILVVETLVPRVWKDKDGKLKTQTPKTQGANNPDKALTYKGSPIYRNSTLSFDESKVDILIQADGTVEATKKVDDKTYLFPVNQEKVNEAIKSAIKAKRPGFTPADLAVASEEVTASAEEALDAGM